MADERVDATRPSIRRADRDLLGRPAGRRRRVRRWSPCVHGRRPRPPRRLCRRRDGVCRPRPGADSVAQTGSRTAPTSSAAGGISSRSPSPRHATRSTASFVGPPGRCVSGCPIASSWNTRCGRSPAILSRSRWASSTRSPTRACVWRRRRRTSAARLARTGAACTVSARRHADRGYRRSPRAGQYRRSRTRAACRCARRAWKAPTSTSAHPGRSARRSSTTPSPISSATTTDSRASSFAVPPSHHADPLALASTPTDPYVQLLHGDPLPSVNRRRPRRLEPMTCPANASLQRRGRRVLEPASHHGAGGSHTPVA